MCSLGSNSLLTIISDESGTSGSNYSEYQKKVNAEHREKRDAGRHVTDTDSEDAQLDEEASEESTSSACCHRCDAKGKGKQSRGKSEQEISEDSARRHREAKGKGKQSTGDADQQAAEGGAGKRYQAHCQTLPRRRHMRWASASVRRPSVLLRNTRKTSRIFCWLPD